jgi:outer membrane protein
MWVSEDGVKKILVVQHNRKHRVGEIMNKKAIIIITVLMGIFLNRVGAAEEWDLKTCLDIGLKQNPTIRAAMKGIEGAEARVKQNQSTYYPVLFGETDYSRYNTLSTLGGPSTSYKNIADLTTYYLGLSQNIYDFGRREYKVKASKEDLKTYQWSLKDIRLSVIDAIRQAYLGVLLAQRVVKVRQEDLKQAQEHFKQAEGFYQVGLKARIDVTQAEVAVITTQKVLLQAENYIHLTRIALAAAMGLDKLEGITLKDNLGIGLVHWNLEEIQQEALEKDPVLNRLKVVINYWEAVEEEAKREFLPALTGTAKYGGNTGTYYSNDETWNLGLQLNIPLFSGFFKKYKLEEIRAALSSAKANEATQKLSVISNIQNQYYNQVLAEKQIDVAKEAMRSAKENLDLAEGRYTAGVGNMLDVTDARTSFVQAENDYNQALYDYVTSYFKVERAMGRE